MKKLTRVTMRDVARAAGVVPSTVSRALRNDPSLPEERCRSIQSIAQKLRYTPNPMIASLMAQLHHRRRRSDPHQLAWIDLWDSPDQSDVHLNLGEILQGAQDRAQEMGYGIERIPLAREKISPDRLARLLSARGQWGLIFPPVPKTLMNFPFEMRGFAGVAIGTSLRSPVMHRVTPNHYRGCCLAYEKLFHLGFRRIGLVLSETIHARVEGRWLGAFLASQQARPAKDRLPPLLLPNGASIAPIQAWLKRYRPDAVLAAEPIVWPLTDPKSIPAMAWLMHPPTSTGLGWLDNQSEQLGRVAVEIVVAQIHRNERGSPSLPQSIMIDPVWEPGVQPTPSIRKVPS